MAQGVVALRCAGHQLGAGDGAVLHGIHLEGLGLAEVLEDLAVFVVDCNFHDAFSFVCVLKQGSTLLRQMQAPVISAAGCGSSGMA